jgi:hypothetical protein
MIRFPSSAKSGDIAMLGQMLVNLGSWWEFRERHDLDWNMQTACLASIQEMLPRQIPKYTPSAHAAACQFVAACVAM